METLRSMALRAFAARVAVWGLVLPPASGCREGEVKSDGETKRDPSPAQLVLGTTQEPATLDPAFAVRSGAQAIVRLLYPDLTVFDDRGNVVPRLAARLPEVSTTSVAIRVRWTLRSGHRWSDGRPLTATDVRFGWTIERRADLQAVNRDFATRVERFDVLGPREFRVTWPNGQRGIADPRVHSVLPAHAYPTPDGPGFSGLGRDGAPSSGPYRLVRWEPGQRIVLEANPGWPGPAPQISRLVWRFFPSADGFEPALAAGELDALGPASGLDHRLADRLDRRLSETHVVISTPSGLLLQLTPRLDHPTVGRLAIRRAIDRAIDRERMAELVYGGRARPARGLFGPVHPARPTPRKELRGDGVAEARALVEAAEAQEGLSPVQLGFASESAASTRAATFLQAELTQIGLKVELVGMPLRVLYDRLKRGRGPAMTLFAWRTRPDWSGRALLHRDGRLNHAGFRDPEVDRLLDEAGRTIDDATWRGLLREVDERVRERLPLIPLLFRDDVSLKPRRLRGWRPTGTTTPVTWNAEEWRLEAP